MNIFAIFLTELNRVHGIYIHTASPMCNRVTNIAFKALLASANLALAYATETHIYSFGVDIEITEVCSVGYL